MNCIHPANRLVLELPPEHPAHASLVARLECQQECAGCEIEQSGKNTAFDQEWVSTLDGRTWRFSGLVYSLVCFDLILSEWIEHPPHITASEETALAMFPDMHLLLDECEFAAREKANVAVLERTPKVRRFFTLWEAAIRLRIAEDGLVVNRG